MNSEHIQYKGVAAIFCGGRSERMGGEPKAGIIGPDGLTLVEHVYRAIEPVCSKIVLVGHAEGVPRSLIHLPRLKDQYPLYGPMGGLATLLDSKLADEYLIAPCDLMGCRSELFEFMIQQQGPLPVVLRDDKGLDPLVGRYGPEIYEEVVKRLRTKKLAMHQLVQDLNGQAVQPPGDLVTGLKNINTPEDLS